jgi:hypothetical protein
MLKTRTFLSMSLLGAAAALIGGYCVAGDHLAIQQASAAPASCPAQTILFAGACRNAAWIDDNLAPGNLPFLGAASTPGGGIVVYERLSPTTARGTVLSTALPLPAGDHPHPTRGGYNIEKILELQVFNDANGHRFFQRTDKHPEFVAAHGGWSMIAEDWSALEVRPDLTFQYTNRSGASVSMGSVAATWSAQTTRATAILLDGALDVTGTSSDAYRSLNSTIVVAWIPTPWDCPPGFMYDCNIVSVLEQDGAHFDDNGDLVVEAHNEDEFLCGCWNGNDYLLGSGWL